MFSQFNKGIKMSSSTGADAVSATTNEPKPDLKPLRILELIKNAQQKHGLRHENYQRYRGYCGRRVERIRKSLKFTNQYKCLPKRPGKFIPRVVSPELVGDIRYLEMVVFELERNWAFAMECKFELIDQPLSRKKFVMRQKLRKAAKWADFLESLLQGNALVQDITKMEAKSHCAFIRASLALELKQWKSAAEHFDGARSGYAELCEGVKGMDIYELYANKHREMEKLLKLCRNESGDANILLSAVNSINLNISDMDESQKQIPMEIQETNKPNAAESKKSSSKKEKKMKERKEAKPFTPFFYDLLDNAQSSSS